MANEKYFEVKREELVGMLTSGEVYSDGEYIALPDDIEARTITIGFSVYEYDENGKTDKVVFYPVKTDTESFTDDEYKVLKNIKKDYRPELGWQNHNW